MHVTKIVGFQQFTSNTLTAVVSPSTSLLITGQGIQANAAIISVGGSTGAIRFLDISAPTSNIGMRLAAGTLPYFYQGDIQNLKFIADAVPGNADANIQYVNVCD